MLTVAVRSAGFQELIDPLLSVHEVRRFKTDPAAYELGPKRIRVHAISPGPIATRAASGLKEFDVLLAHAVAEAPLGEPVDILDVGMTCAHLASPLARHLTGATHYIDGGLNIMA